MKRVRLDISGKVQGVYFRDSTQQRARELQVTGWVRNREDGGVEVEAQGPDAAVDQLVRWCHDGPERAEVTELVAHEISPASSEDGFEVR